MIAKLDPQMAAALEKSETLAPPLGAVAELPMAEIRRRYKAERRYWNEDRPEVAKVIDDTIAGPVGPVPIRRYYPSEDGSLPALVFAHGGGFIMGDLDTHDKIMRMLAVKSGAAVVGIDYTLSPEQRFPVAIEECLALVDALATRGGEWGIDPSRLAMGGDSAGAMLTIGTALSGAPDRLMACLLYYGGYGLKDSLSRRLFGGDGMSEEDMAFYRDCYLGDDPPADDPRLHSLAADLSGLPPLFVAAAELDPIRDDSLALAALAEAQGVTQRLEVYAGMPHGFLHYSRMVDAAGRALEDGSSFLREIFAGDRI